MFAIVYRCHREGQRLTRELIAADPVRGELSVQRRGMKRIAQLLGADMETYLLPVLDKVVLLAMNERGVLLSGIECFPPRGAKGNGPVFAQTWWCILEGKVVQPDDLIEERRAGAAIGASMVNHYARRRG